MPVIRFELPVPPSRNVTDGTHHMKYHREKRAYQREVWLAAIDQHPPSLEPPEYVTMSVVFMLKRLRDRDNLDAKWACDALKQRQISAKWKGGIADKKGYFIDDDPTHLDLQLVAQTQVADRECMAIMLSWE
jgi:hypothetical protein